MTIGHNYRNFYVLNTSNYANMALFCVTGGTEFGHMASSFGPFDCFSEKRLTDTDTGVSNVSMRGGGGKPESSRFCRQWGTYQGDLPQVLESAEARNRALDVCGPISAVSFGYFRKFNDDSMRFTHVYLYLKTSPKSRGEAREVRADGGKRHGLQNEELSVL